MAPGFGRVAFFYLSAMPRSHIRSVKTKVIRKRDGRVVEEHPEPMGMAPLTTQAVQPDLVDIFDDLPVVDEFEQDKPDVERSSDQTGSRHLIKLPVISYQRWDINPSEFFPEFAGK